MLCFAFAIVQLCIRVRALFHCAACRFQPRIVVDRFLLDLSKPLQGKGRFVSRAVHKLF
jgi:hypothetical protein